MFCFQKQDSKNSKYNWEASSDNIGTPFNVYATYKVTCLFLMELLEMD